MCLEENYSAPALTAFSQSPLLTHTDISTCWHRRHPLLSTASQKHSHTHSHNYPCKWGEHSYFIWCRGCAISRPHRCMPTCAHWDWVIWLINDISIFFGYDTIYYILICTLSLKCTFSNRADLYWIWCIAANTTTQQQGCVLAKIWWYDTYHDTGVTNQYIEIYCI